MNIAATQLPSDLADATPGQFVNEASLEACRFQGIDLSTITARAVSLDEVLLEKVVLVEAKLEKLAANDLLAKSCDLSAANISDASFLRTAFESGRMSGLDTNKSVFKDVRFQGCKLDLTNFRFTKLKNVQFVDCVLTDADFLGAELSHVVFENCELERTDFTQCKMHEVDLRSSQLLEVKGWQFLKGAIIDDVQLMSVAPWLANELGIKVVS